jgi:hypothetical protein
MLELKGFRVDEVVGAVELLRVSAEDSIDLHQLSKPLRDCFQLMSQVRVAEGLPAVYKDGFTWESAFCRTLVGDLVVDELPLDRIATYGRTRLEADFEELFDKLQVTLDTKLLLDFAADFDPSSPAYSSVYSPIPSVDLPSPPTHPATLAAYSPTSPVYSGHSWATEHEGDQDGGQDQDQVIQTAKITGVPPKSAEEVLKELKRSSSNSSLQRDHENSSQDGHGSEKPAGRESSALRFGNVKDVPLLIRQQPEPVATAIKDSFANVMEKDSNMPHTCSQAPRSPRKSDASYGSRFSAYSETHWITLPTEHNPYLSAEEDERRRSRIRRLRGEFLTTEGSLPGSHHRPESDVFTNLYESLIGMMENQTFFITKTGYIGIGPPQTTAGDQVWIFNGGNVPFMMRKVGKTGGEGPQLALIGDVYVHGIMDGEAIGSGSLMQTVYIH